jgi:hypothetical protein
VRRWRLLAAFGLLVVDGLLFRDLPFGGFGFGFLFELGLAGALHVLALSALVALDVYELALFVADGVELLARFTTHDAYASSWPWFPAPGL